MRPVICLVQPPFVQLNSPYPGIFYLRSFLERRGFTVYVRDHSIGLFGEIFCRDGLRRIFADARQVVVDKRFRRIVKRFLDEEELWLFSIDKITGLLRGREKEWGHFLCRANGAVPGGPRFDARVAELREVKGEPLPEDAQLLASLLLADIADFITVTLDPGFSLIRYVPSPSAVLSAGFRDFQVVREGIDGYVMREFYRPFLAREWKDIALRENICGVNDGGDAGENAGDDAGKTAGKNAGARIIAAVSIPFPGCLAGALVCAESAKAFFGGAVCAVAGGGYVNTEMRFINDERFFHYFDYLSFDRGYGSLAAILERLECLEREMENADAGGAARDFAPLYKTIFLGGNGIVRHDSIDGDCADEKARIDDEAAVSFFPDYSGVDFSRYICPVDDENPMHRLWSDGRWLKVYAAHGCYWKKCAFCDVTLDYIGCYRRVDVNALFRHLLAQSQASGIRGIHLVDEACPPASLRQLALLNREAGLPLVFWGNARFEKTFTREMAAVLAAGGFIGFSAGIEIAAEKDVDRVGKGISLADIVNVCAAFKEAGILVHAYLIYGYYDSSAQEIINSAEILRQFFAAGILDSAFWHKFTLTIHSRLYAEKLQGLHPGLRPRDNPLVDGRGGKIFALNDISFEGEDRFDKFGAPLDNLLARWMRGDTECPIVKAFSFKVPKPEVPPGMILRLLQSRDGGR
ncbi:MAG TPA: radical SAM protein [Treponema sp.]|nr:radical SAM protein [Treponema sp.]